MMRVTLIISAIQAQLEELIEVWSEELSALVDAGLSRIGIGTN